MIDRQTVEKIKDAANIVDVVSEFVTLKKSGANYKGLCPFHNEKTPSFYVSPARGTCHCFGCGKGGNAVTFIMEHEQLTYPEALRWLAKKYHIEIHERELTNEEKEEQSKRESMFIVNEWAEKYFEDLLHNHPDGQAIGLQYFRSRGFRDDIIKKFNLGYDLPDRFLLASAAKRKGYKAEFLTATGLCYQTERGELIDRFAGRVVFPWTGVSGKVVGFTARVLDKRTKGVNQKYVNSPDSEVFHKDHELYGIWQAKRAIAKEDRVYMVEGQADVISMHQCGIENVVANSGTALSIHQIHMLHRFTSNITLIYDGDAAGIHAALRGTDMLLSEGMSLRVLLLPGGQDPDEFARTHTAEDFKKYIEEHQEDFIQFKTDLLLKGETDPKKRADGISSIVESISVIQDPILRDTYIHDCSQRIGISEATLINRMNGFIRSLSPTLPRREESLSPTLPRREGESGSGLNQRLYTPPYGGGDRGEASLLRLLIKHGECVIYKDVKDDEGGIHNLTVAQVIAYSLGQDGLDLGNDLYNAILNEAAEKSSDPQWKAEPYFLHHDDINICQLATQLSADRYHITEQKEEGPQNKEAELQRAENKAEAIRNQTEHLLLDFRMAYVERHLKELQAEMSRAGNDMAKIKKLMADYKDMQQIRNALAKQLGNSIIL
ncbi:MAG: DNA primase [Prevotella sp.]